MQKEWPSRGEKWNDGVWFTTYSRMSTNRKGSLHSRCQIKTTTAIWKRERKNPSGGLVILSKDTIFSSYFSQLCQWFSHQRSQGRIKLITIKCSLTVTTDLDESKWLLSSGFHIFFQHEHTEFGHPPWQTGSWACTLLLTGSSEQASKDQEEIYLPRCTVHELLQCFLTLNRSPS